MSRNVTKKIDRLRDQFSGNNARFCAFAAFLTLVFFTGGSSRDDVQSLIILRPLAVLFGAYALMCIDRDAWKGRMFPLYIALALAGLMVFQLIPLPPNIWTALPGRHIFAEIADLAGIEQPWRPLTLSPSRTINSLFSVAIPVTTMMLYLNLGERDRKHAVTVIIALAGISALWAAAQLTGSGRSPFYLYNITNNGAAVGLFANRNHQAVLLAATIVMLGWYGASHAVTSRLAALKFYGSIAAIFVVVALIMITGSRAGLILMGPALIAAIVLIFFGRFSDENHQSGTHSRTKKKWYKSRQTVLIATIALVLIVGSLSIYFSRSLAFDRLFERADVEGLRSQLLPVLMKMMEDYLPWGSGFGSFEHVYRIHEPLELLNPTYLNQAHNDWLQFVIEGGLPAVLIAMLAVIWSIKQFFTLVKNWGHSRYAKHIVMMSASVILLFLAGSIGDYPLRVPSLIAVFSVMACILRDNLLDARQRRARTTPCDT